MGGRVFLTVTLYDIYCVYLCIATIKHTADLSINHILVSIYTKYLYIIYDTTTTTSTTTINTSFINNLKHLLISLFVRNFYV